MTTAVDPAVPNPTAGGSYVRNADGTLTRVEGPQPEATPNATADLGQGSGDPPAGDEPAGG